MHCQEPLEREQILLLAECKFGLQNMNQVYIIPSFLNT